MNTVFRPFLAIVLALVLALTGHSMALARGAADPAGQMVLCTGAGPVTIFVDENGTPTGPPAFCPDCALHHLAAVALPHMAVLAIVARPTVLATRAAHLHGVESRPHAMARAPPCVV